MSRSIPSDMDALSGREEAIERLAGDADIYEQACVLFLRGWEGKYQALARGLDGRDLEQASLSAHSLKGNCAMIGAEASCAAAREVEKACREQDLDRARQALPRLKDELLRVVAALAKN